MGSDMARGRIASGQAWEEFCDRLKDAGKIILGPDTPRDELDRAEGWRYLSRLTRMAFEQCFENADPDFPNLLNIPNTTEKAGADNPDMLYFTAPVRGDREYRLRGTRGTVPWLTFGTKAFVAGPDGSPVALATGGLDGRNLLVNPDGTFEIAVTREPRPGNWLPLGVESNILLVRQRFLDKAREVPANLTIERVGGPAKPRPLTAAQTDWALKSAAHVLTRIARRYADWSRWYQGIPNTLRTLEGSPLREEASDPNTRYFYGYWSLAPDEALVIDTPVPVCEVWNFQVNNYWWESLDYRYYRTSVNQHSARYNSDGSVTLVVGPTNPGHDNFVETAGHLCGTMVLRWVRAEQHPIPVCRVEKLAALRT